MNAIITNFTNENIRFGRGLVVSTISVVNAYVLFNNGSTAGKLKLYAHLQSLDGVTKVRSEFYGMDLKPIVEPVVEPVVEPIVQPVVEPIVEPTMSAYEMKCIELKEKKMEEARKLKEAKMAETRKLEEAKMVETRKIEENKIELKEKKLKQQVEIEEMKLSFKSKCFERAMDFQREVNNQNRYMTVGYAIPKREYIALGTASNVHIEYDSAVDNLNELEFDQEIKAPIERCYKDQVISIEMMDKTIEKAIPLSNMIAIHHFVIIKLDSSELSESDKQNIADEYEKEEYAEVRSIIDDLDVSFDDPKQQIAMLVSEIMRLREIETEARLYSRVSTKAYNRSMHENTKMSEKIGRKSMLPPSQYVVAENHIRHDEEYNQIVDCYCCGTAIDIRDAHRSHIVAKELGGTCDKENVRICCKKCNLDMGIMDLEAYKASLG